MFTDVTEANSSKEGLTLPRSRVSGSLFGKNGVIGLALVVHDAVDDLGLGAPGSGSQLTGNAGARLACGIVKVGNG